MTTMLQADELPKDFDPLAPREVTIKGVVSAESLRRLQADYNPGKSLRMGILKLQFGILMTWFEEFRDLVKPTIFADQPRDVPAERLSEHRHEIARLARAGMEHLEIAAMYAEKAMALHNQTEQPDG